MPTAAKLFAAIAFAVIGFAAAEAFKPQMPPETTFGVFSLICAAIGAVCGWKIMGPRVRQGWVTAMSVGVTTAAAMTGLALLGFSVREMIIRSLNRRFDGPLDALLGTFEIALEYAWLLVDIRVMGVLVIGALLGGIIAEAAGRRWR